MKITLLTGKTFDIKEELGIDIKVVPSRSLHKLVLKIDNKERIPVLSVPKFCSRRRAVSFVNENMGWIMTTMAKLPPIKEFENGEKISLFGENVVIAHSPDARCGVRKENDLLIVSGGAEFLHRRVRDFIKKQAKIVLLGESVSMAQKIGCKVNDVTIKDTKSRWGSCSGLGNINYSWRIALAPSYVIKYLVAHEVSHLLHQDHSSDFWKCVEELYPEWKNGHDWLKKYGKTLYKYK